MQRTMNQTYSFVIILLQCILLVACEEQASVFSTYAKPGGTRSFMEYASNTGPLLLMVQGHAFTERSKDEQDAALARTMGDLVMGRVVRFTTDPGAAPQRTYRTMLVFNVPRDTNANLVCQGEIPDQVAPDKHHFVLAVFCSRGDLLAAARGLIRVQAGVEDAETREVLKGLVGALYVTEK